MITTLPESAGNALGFAVAGDVTREDYQVLTPAVEQAIDRFGSARLILDLTDFRWEKVDAWGDDLRFGKQLHDRIDKMAIVGSHTWERYLAKLCTPFYAKQAQYFDNRDDAWAWIRA